MNPAFVHLFVEAGRIAEVDRLDVVGDPDRGAPSALPQLDKNYLTARVAQIASATTLRDPIAPGTPAGLQRPACASGTTPWNQPDQHRRFRRCDRLDDDNHQRQFWSMALGGCLFNDASTNFAAAENGLCPANAAAGNKRAETSVTPVIVTDANDRIIMLSGSAGGAEIVDYVAQTMIAIINGVSALAAIDAGHGSVARSPYPQSAGVVELEADRSVANLAGALTQLGYRVTISRLHSGVAFIVRRGIEWGGAADPRRRQLYHRHPVGHLTVHRSTQRILVAKFPLTSEQPIFGGDEHGQALE